MAVALNRMAPVWAELLEGLSPHNDEHTPICEFSEGPPLKATMIFYGCPACVISLHAHAARTPAYPVRHHDPQTGDVVMSTAAVSMNSMILELGLPLPLIPLPS